MFRELPRPVELEEEVLRYWKDARIFHHRTRQMKLRKALFSVTDVAMVRESARKGAEKVRRRVTR